jgi:hypothetical protein
MFKQERKAIVDATATAKTGIDAAMVISTAALVVAAAAIVISVRNASNG